MWPNPQFPADLVTFTEEILDEKLNFLRSEFQHSHPLPFRSSHSYMLFKIGILKNLAKWINWKEQYWFFWALYRIFQVLTHKFRIFLFFEFFLKTFSEWDFGHL